MTDPEQAPLLERILLPYDTETTGIPFWKEQSELEKQPHLVQLAAQRVNAHTREVEAELNHIIKPNGWIIPQECIDIHGITNEKAHDVGVPESEVVAEFLEFRLGVDYRIAFNQTFDERIIRIALKRYFPAAADDFKPERRFDPMWAFRKLVQYPKMPKLVEAYVEFFGQEFEDQHTAMGDVKAMMKVYWELVDRYTDVDFKINGDK